MTATIVTTLAAIITFAMKWWWSRQENESKEDEIHAADAKILQEQRDNNVTDISTARRMYNQLKDRFNK